RGASTELAPPPPSDLGPSVPSGGEGVVHDLHLGLLLGAVDDELAAEHGDVRVHGGLVLVLVLLAGAVEGVAGAVAADEALALGDGVEQGLLALGRHRRGLLSALPRPGARRPPPAAV